MGVPVLIMGESGTGKSTSIRTFGPDEVTVINCLGKPLPFRSNGIKSFQTLDLKMVRSAIMQAPTKTVVVDDFGYCITSLYIRHSYGEEKYKDQYQIYKEIAAEVWDTVLTALSRCAPDVTVYFVMHSAEENGQLVPSTVGRMLNEKINLVGMFTITMLSIHDGDGYGFIVGDKPPTKAPEGVFSDSRVENDLRAVDERIRAYWGIQRPEKAIEEKEV